MGTIGQAAYNTVANGDANPILALLVVIVLGSFFAMIIGAFGNKNGAMLMVLVTVLSGITVAAKAAYSAIAAAAAAVGLK